MTTKVPQDQKKEEFRKYLEKAGVLDLLTTNLVKLYEEPEKPNDALQYLKNNIGGSKDDKETIEKLRAENESLKEKVAELERDEEELKAKLAILPNPAADSPTPPADVTPVAETTEETKQDEPELKPVDEVATEPMDTSEAEKSGEPETVSSTEPAVEPSIITPLVDESAAATEPAAVDATAAPTESPAVESEPSKPE